MSNAVIARFPLGVYQGHQADGQPERYPQVTRLFSALVSAAWRGSTAEGSSGALHPSSDASAALAWLEGNPPDGLLLPDVAPTRSSAITSYRREGTFEKGRDKKGRDKVAGKAIGEATALSAPLGWVWASAIPVEISSALDALCADVAYLGESDSPVILELGDVEPTHYRDDAATAFNSSGTTAVRVPIPGRAKVLDEAHAREHPKKRPTEAQDRFAMTGEPTPPTSAGTAGTTIARYRLPMVRPTANGPWGRVVLIPTNGKVDAADTVSWCVALHRALAWRLGDWAPAVITGSYAAGVRQPANRVAIHLLDPSLTKKHNINQQTFALLIPNDIAPDDHAALDEGLRGLTKIFRGRLGELQLGAPQNVSALDFWPSPSEDTVRLWRTVTPVVAETRPQSTTDGRRWTLADAALLSVAFVARDNLHAEGRGASRYNAMVEKASVAGVRVSEIHRVADSHTGRYAHKVPKSVVVLPYHAMFDLSTLWSENALVALGQSRHLGGGLLAPLDVPSAVAETWFPR